MESPACPRPGFIDNSYSGLPPGSRWQPRLQVRGGYRQGAVLVYEVVSGRQKADGDYLEFLCLKSFISKKKAGLLRLFKLMVNPGSFR